MKRYILNILLFFVIVAAIDVCVGGIGDYLQAHARGGEAKRINDLVMNEKHDIVILGSSRARHHYDAPFLSNSLGLDFYNAGYDGNGIVLAYGLLELILERYKPRLIIYDVEPAFDIIEYPNDNNNKRYISILKPYFRHSAVGGLIRDVSLEEWYKDQSGMIRYNSSLVALVVDNIRRSEDNNRGFKALEGIYLKEKVDKEDEQYQIDGLKIKYVEQLIKVAKNHNLPIVLVVSPKLGKFNTECLRTVTEICEINDVPLLNYYADTVFQKNEYFKEPMHLNAKGARCFSTQFLKDIHDIISY